MYVLDTNVILNNPNSFNSFGPHDVVIPMTVIEEVDNHKKGREETAFKARSFIRMLDKLQESGSLAKGVSLGDGKGMLRIVASDSTDPKNDNKIIAVALALKAKRQKVVMVSEDLNVRLKADALGLEVRGADEDVEEEELYKGFAEFAVDDAVLSEFYSGHELHMDKEYELVNNQYVILRNGVSEPTVGRYNSTTEIVNKLAMEKHRKVSNIVARNVEQQIALDLLMDDSLPLVSLVGKAGCGKTLLALAAGLEKVDKGRFERLLISRPVIPFGKDIGFLPGPQPLDAQIATPNGWTTMGALQVGDYVIGRDGFKTKVLGIFPKGVKDVYTVTTTDGTKTECCIDHLWLSQTAEEVKRGKPGSVKTTQDMLKNLKTANGKWNQILPRNEPVQYETSSPLPLPPYTLGCLLGNGSLRDSITLSDIDPDLVQKVSHEMHNIGIEVVRLKDSINYNFRDSLYNNKPAKPVIITDTSTGENTVFASVGVAAEQIGVDKGTIGSRCCHNRTIDGLQFSFGACPVRWSNSIKNTLHELGLLGKRAWEKFIPPEFKFAPVEDRIELLRGLMDTDGCVKERTGECSYTTTSMALAKDIQELTRSLGGRATVRERNRIGHATTVKGTKHVITSRRVSYDVSISLPVNPFFIRRKAERYRFSYSHMVKVESIEQTGKKEVQCILVDSPEHLYLTDGFIVTHNTIDEKLSPYMGPIQDNLEAILGGGPSKKGVKRASMEDLIEQNLLKVEALTFIRGRSLANQFWIIDEAQNLSPFEMKTILTRVGENCRVILTGDIKQVDNPSLDVINNGLTHVVEKFKGQRLFGHITLSECIRSELANLASDIL